MPPRAGPRMTMPLTVVRSASRTASSPFVFVTTGCPVPPPAPRGARETLAGLEDDAAVQRRARAVDDDRVARRRGRLDVGERGEGRAGASVPARRRARAHVQDGRGRGRGARARAPDDDRERDEASAHARQYGGRAAGAVTPAVLVGNPPAHLNPAGLA